MLGPDFFAVGSKKILDWLFWIKNLDTEPNPPLLQRGIKGDFRPTAPRPHGAKVMAIWKQLSRNPVTGKRCPAKNAWPPRKSGGYGLPPWPAERLTRKAPTEAPPPAPGLPGPLSV